MEYLYVAILTVLVNIPFGFLRGGTRQFSVLWFLYIHLPVPVVILIRHWFGVELSWAFLPLFFGCYFLGQWTGSKFQSMRSSEQKESG